MGNQKFDVTLDEIAAYLRRQSKGVFYKEQVNLALLDTIKDGVAAPYEVERDAEGEITNMTFIRLSDDARNAKQERLIRFWKSAEAEQD